MTAPKICVLGSVNLDMIIQTETLPRAGETVAQGQFQSLPGGKGANVALAAKRLGADVELRGAIGEDDYADQALQFLRDGGVDLSGLIKLDDSHTGLAFINVSADGENQIAVASGANAAFTPSHLKLTKADALVTQFEIPIETIHAAIKDFEGFVCINASPVTDGLETLIKYADLIIVNEGEHAAYENELKSYTGLLAITLGSKGARFEQDGKTLAKAVPPKVDVVDTTGAGDSFAAALTVALTEGQSHQDALNFACTVGALTTTKLGTQAATPVRAVVDKRIN